MSADAVDLKRRDFLVKATTAMGAVGMAAVAVPFVGSMLPSAEAESLGEPIKVDIAGMKPGDQLTVEWRGRPVWVIYRTQQALASLKQVEDRLRDPDSKVQQQPEYARNEMRSIKPEYLVLIGVCTHLGCSPTYRPDVGSLDKDWPGGFFCSCHGSKFDMAGRVFKGVPAPINLEVPRYAFLDDKTIIIGTEKQPEQA